MVVLLPHFCFGENPKSDEVRRKLLCETTYSAKEKRRKEQ
jgi:hypothetical protein